MSVDRSKIIAAIPLVGVNIIAVYGQYGYLRDHLSWPGLPVMGAAITIESIAVYLAYMAHKSLIALDTSMRLRLAAYGFGILAGLMNLSHYSPGWHITAAGIILGTLSASSPWLWAVYSRRQSRDILAEKGLIEPGAVRLGNRWLVHPIWCIPVYRYAVWNGVRNPTKAIEDYQESIPEPVTETVSEIETIPEPEPEPVSEPEPEPYEPVSFASKSDAVRAAFNVLGIESSAPAVVTWLAERGVTVKDDFVRSIRSIDKRKSVTANRSTIRAIAAPETRTKQGEA